MIDLLRDIEESVRERGGWIGRFVETPIETDSVVSRTRLNSPETQPSQPVLAESKPSNDVAFRKSAKSASADVDGMLRGVCNKYGVTRSWLEQIVLCEQGLEDLGHLALGSPQV